jgi:hypothetical protein
MKTLHHLIAAMAIITTGTIVQANPPALAPSIANLRITSVIRNGNTAWVKVENNGTANAGACTFQAIGIKNGVYTNINAAVTNVNAFQSLASGQTRWVMITDPKINSAQSPVL